MTSILKSARETLFVEIGSNSSTAVILAIAEALEIAVMMIRSFIEEKFARFKPGGTLGKRLLVKVEDVMSVNYIPFIEHAFPL